MSSSIQSWFERANKMKKNMNQGKIPTQTNFNSLYNSYVNMRNMATNPNGLEKEQLDITFSNLYNRYTKATTRKANRKGRKTRKNRK